MTLCDCKHLAHVIVLWQIQKCICYCTVLLCFILYLRALSKYKPPGAYIRRGDLTEVFLCYEVEGFIFVGAFSYMEGLIFGILRYIITAALMYQGSKLDFLTFYVNNSCYVHRLLYRGKRNSIKIFPSTFACLNEVGSVEQNWLQRDFVKFTPARRSERKSSKYLFSSTFFSNL